MKTTRTNNRKRVLEPNRFDIFNYKKPKEFKQYLASFYANTKILEELDYMSKSSDVYVFSGIIRDFFIESKATTPRDLDIVIGNGKRESIPVDYLRKVKYTTNQFGGVKLQDMDKVVDVWQLKDTWGIKRKNSEATPEELINTAFFNFSAVAFDYGKEKFIVSEAFNNFLNNKVLDIVYEDNPLPDLCIVNSLYYSQKLKCRISERLASWIISHYEQDQDFSSVQIRHFGTVVYSNIEIGKFVSKLSS